MTDYSKYSENKPMDFHTVVEPDYPTIQTFDNPEPIPVKEWMKETTNEYEVINCSSLNIREQPSKDSKSLQIVRAGAKLQVMAVDGVWAYVETEAGIVGYTMTKYIQI